MKRRSEDNSRYEGEESMKARNLGVLLLAVGFGTGLTTSSVIGQEVYRMNFEPEEGVAANHPINELGPWSLSNAQENLVNMHIGFALRSVHDISALDWDVVRKKYSSDNSALVVGVLKPDPSSKFLRRVDGPRPIPQPGERGPIGPRFRRFIGQLSVEAVIEGALTGDLVHYEWEQPEHGAPVYGGTVFGGAPITPFVSAGECKVLAWINPAELGGKCILSIVLLPPTWRVENQKIAHLEKLRIIEKQDTDEALETFITCGDGWLRAAMIQKLFNGVRTQTPRGHWRNELPNKQRIVIDGLESRVLAGSAGERESIALGVLALSTGNGQLKNSMLKTIVEQARARGDKWIESAFWKPFIAVE